MSMLHVIMCMDHTRVHAKLDIRAMGKHVLVRKCKTFFVFFLTYYKTSRRTSCYSENVMSTAQSTAVFFIPLSNIYTKEGVNLPL